MDIFYFHSDIEAFIHTLNPGTIAKTYRIMNVLKIAGAEIGFPQSRALSLGLFELRIRGTQEVRLIYTFHRNSAVILCGFLKTTHRIPRRILTLAHQRKSQLV
jgi:hypothetical protein